MRTVTTLLLLFLFSCAADPLEVRVVEVDDPLTDDGLEAAPTTAGSVGGTGELELLDAHEALSLSFAFRATEGARAELLLQGKYPVSLPDLVSVATGKDAVPQKQPAPSPGVWQEVELSFLPASETESPLLASLYLNGELIHYQVVLDRQPGPAGPLLIRGEAGEVEIENVRFGSLAGRTSSLRSDGSVSLSIPLLRYTYYDLPAGTKEVTDWDDLTPTRSGYLGRMDLEAVKSRRSDFAVRFSGPLAVPRAGEYTFTVQTATNTRLFLDEQLIVDHPGQSWLEDTSATVRLEEKTYDFRLEYIEGGGWNELELTYTDPTGHTGHLNDIDDGTAYTRPGTGATSPLETDDRPYLLRSFMIYPPRKVYEPANKLTHALSVGEGNGPHYAVDLNSGALLTAWRGGFVNVHDMWVERGHAQTAIPLATGLNLETGPQWSAAPEEEWPDAHEAGSWQHRRYELDGAGRPTFHYTYAGSEVTDRIEPGPDGLTRTLTNQAGSKTLYTQLAAARSITETAPGAFQLRGPGASLSIIDNGGNELVLQRGEGRSRLLSRVAPGNSVTYTLNW